MNEININKGYELFQIITDFGDPLEIFREAFQNAFDENATRVFCNVYESPKLSRTDLIIDIWNNGLGLPKGKVACFFDLANSSKIDQNRIPIKGKLGYKGHGSKIYFNAEKVQILSKETNDICWGVELVTPIQQIERKGTIFYSKFMTSEEIGIALPSDWKQGFFLRIINPLHFKTQHTTFKLNHQKLRDYIKWFTVFGTIQTIFDKELANKDIKLFLRGLNFENFHNSFSSIESIDPLPSFDEENGLKYEVLNLGHYFPEERYTDTNMRAYAKKIKSTKAYYEYYSRMVYKEKVYCSNNVNFNIVINLEGYETKRRYDILLTRRGKQRTDITHTDSERYGLWACKGGIPVEKIDDWLEGGKGTYSFMQAFVDCDDFQLTANRGSIHNTDIEKLDIIKKEINRIFKDQKIKDAIAQRTELEKFENQLTSIEEDGKNLKDRYKEASKKKSIILPNGVKLKEPTKKKSGYSESETLILFINIINNYPNLFNFNILDYNTTKGIDFVVEYQGAPKYIELKGTMHKKINHPFRHLYKFVCYDIDFSENDIISDNEEFKASLKINTSDKFHSFDEDFKNKQYTSYQLISDSAFITSMEIINLRLLLTQVIGATIL